MSISHHPFYFPPSIHHSLYSPANFLLPAAVPANSSTGIYKTGSLSQFLCLQFHGISVFSRLTFSEIFSPTLPNRLDNLIHCPLLPTGHLQQLAENVQRNVFLLKTSTTTMNNSGLRALPSLLTMNSSDIPTLHITLPFVSSYLPSTILSSGTSIHLNVATANSPVTVYVPFQGI